mgnify:CR=1 FL=1
MARTVIEKNSRESIVVSESTHMGYDLVDLRVFYKDVDGALKPTRKGISLHREQVGDVIKALSVIERAKTVTP